MSGMRRNGWCWNFCSRKAIALLAIGEREARDVLFLGIVVDIDVLAGEHVPLEVLVLDLVLAERHRLGPRPARCAPASNAAAGGSRASDTQPGPAWTRTAIIGRRSMPRIGSS
jgi:hypothetical protein